MKGFNVFLAVLIFLLAAVSAVFSYFLFEKRAQLVDGWNDMARQINQTASKLDANSGTSVASKLSTDAMDQKKYADLPALLPALVEQAATVVQERDALAQALSQLGRTLEKGDLSPDKFQKISDYTEALQTLGAYVNAYQTRNNAILAKISQSASDLGASVSVSQLKSTGYGDAYGTIEQRISYYLDRVKAFDSSMRNIASSVDVASPDLSESGYTAGVDSVVNGVQALRRDCDDTHNKLDTANRDIESLKQTVADKDTEIKNLNATIDAKNIEIKSMRKALGMKDEDPLPLQDGCAESLKLIRNQNKGSITEADVKFGFYVVSVGAKTEVEEMLGDHVNHVKTLIPVGAEMVIARNMPGKEAEYIGKLKLVKLGDAYSIAEICDNASGKQPQVGDTVYFSDEEIEKIVKSRK